MERPLAPICSARCANDTVPRSWLATLHKSEGGDELFTQSIPRFLALENLDGSRGLFPDQLGFLGMKYCLDLDHAIGLMTKHRALEDTISRAQHYGAMAVDALALFPPSPMKSALEQVVAFCLARSH